MTFRASRGVRLLLAAALAWLGLALCAQAALATHGRIQVVKINQGGNANDTFAFHPTFTWTGPAAPTGGDFSLKGGEASPTFDVACNVDMPHGTECTSKYSNVTLKVTEQPAAGYSLTDITCRYTQSNDVNNLYSAGPPGPSSPVKPANEVTTDLAAGTVSLKVHYNEWVVCYFTNTAAAPTSQPPPSGGSPPQTTPTPTPTPQPGIEVSPARVRPGSAKLHGPSECATSDVVVARVTGRRIVRVTFYVDSKKVKTLNKANRGRQWVLSVRLRGLAYGAHRVRAKVEFAKSSQTKAKTLPISFSRCRSGAARPQFTG
jgi:hypothetical protein